MCVAEIALRIHRIWLSVILIGVGYDLKFV